MTEEEKKKRTKERNKRWRDSHKEHLRERNRQWVKENKEKHIENSKRWQKENINKSRALKECWRKNNREKVNTCARKWQREHADKMHAWQKKWRQNNKNNIQYRLRHNLRTRLRKAIKNGMKVGSAIKLLGCSIEDLKKRLELLFRPGMTWENYGTYWHIDHLYSLSCFDLSDPEQLQKACHYSNLQPLTALENIKKSDTLPEKPIAI